MRLIGILASGIISVIVFFELSANKFDDPNKDKLLVELVSVVLDRFGRVQFPSVSANIRILEISRQF